MLTFMISGQHFRKQCIYYYTDCMLSRDNILGGGLVDIYFSDNKRAFTTIGISMAPKQCMQANNYIITEGGLSTPRRDPLPTEEFLFNLYANLQDPKCTDTLPIFLAATKLGHMVISRATYPTLLYVGSLQDCRVHWPPAKTSRGQ